MGKQKRTGMTSAALLSALTALGCGEDPAPAPVALPGTPSDQDGGGNDGMPDSSTQGMDDDAGAADADGGSVGDDTLGLECDAVSGVMFEADGHREGIQVLATAVNSTNFHLAYTSLACAVSDTSVGLQYLPFGASGEFGTATGVVNAPPAGANCSGNSSSFPSLLAYEDPVRGEDVVELFFVANNDEGFELYKRELSPQASEESPGVRLTTDPADGRRNETRTAAAVLNGRAVVAWSSDAIDAAATTSEIRTQQVNFQGASNVIVADDEGHQPSWLTLTELGSDQAEKAGALAWVNELGDQRGIWLQALNANGLKSGPPTQLSAEAGGESSVALAGHDSGGAVVYTLVQGQGREIRLRQLDPQGTPVGAEIIVTSGGERAVGASVARWGAGWVVAFRHKVNGDPQNTIRLAFIDTAGNIAGFRSIANASAFGGPTQVRVAVDGRILVSWTDEEGADTKVRALRVVCN